MKTPLLSRFKKNQVHVASFDKILMDEQLKNKLTSVFTITLAIFTLLFVTSCSTSTENVENAENEVVKAEQELKQANAEHLADIESYRIETKEKIDANNQSIINFNKRIESQKKEAKIAYQEEIAALNQQNTDLKKRMDDYKADTKENWQEFKTKFNNDMDELGKALKNFVTDSE